MSPDEPLRDIADPVPVDSTIAPSTFPGLCAELGKVGGREPALFIAAGSGSGAGRAPWLRFLRGVESSAVGNDEELPLTRCEVAAAACAAAAPILGVLCAPDELGIPEVEDKGRETASPKTIGNP